VFCRILLLPDKQEHMDVLLRVRILWSSERAILRAYWQTRLECHTSA